MYALEALALTKSELSSLNHSWARSFEKLFVTFDKNIVKQCQLFNGYMSITHYFCLRSLSFCNNLLESPNMLLRVISGASRQEELNRIANIISCNPNVHYKEYQRMMHEHFRNE